MCQFAVPGLIRSLSGTATRNFSQSRRSSLLCTTRTIGPVCVTAAPSDYSALPYSDISFSISRLANTRRHLLGSTSKARGRLDCWPFTLGDLCVGRGHLTRQLCPSLRWSYF